MAWIIHRDLSLALRRRSDVMSVLLFFIVAATLFPLAVGPQVQVLRPIAPGIVWVAALLASMLSLPRLFAFDLADGTLEQLSLSGEPLALVVLGKVVAHWLVSGLPLVLLAPLLALQFAVPAEDTLTLVVSLLLGTPTLSLIGAVGAALTLGTRGSGALVPLLLLPLWVPVLIFGVGAQWWLLAGLLAGAAALAPWAASAALGLALE